MSNTTVKFISKELKNVLSLEEACAFTDFISLYEGDERAAVKNLVDRAKKSKEKLIAEIKRVEKLCLFDRSFGDYNLVCGIDEVGRGSIAGPVVTCAVIMKPKSALLYVNDSKKLSAKKREELYDKIIADSVAFSFGCIEPKVIDDINILNATKMAMKQSVNGLENKPDLLVVDAVKLDDIDIEKRAIIKGDEKSYACACASILAKVYRDRLMAKYDSVYKGYNFSKNKGYGTREHLSAVMEHGASEIHRLSFIPSECLS